MAEWTAWADETGTQVGSHYCAVLGYVASPRQWKRFRADWRKALNDAKVHEFHAQKFFQRKSWQSRKSPYYGWKGTKARAFLDDLLHIIHSYDVRPIGFAFNVDDFHALAEDERRRLTGATRATRTQVGKGGVKVTDTLLSTGAPTEPYFLGFHYFLAEALRAAAPKVTVNFVFDNRDESGEARAKENRNETVEYSKLPEIRERIGLVSFGDSCKYEPLQAADLYAYVWNRGLHRTLTEPLAHAFEQVTRKRQSMGVADAAFYRGLLNDLDAKRAVGILRTLEIARGRG